MSRLEVIAKLRHIGARFNTYMSINGLEIIEVGKLARFVECRDGKYKKELL